MPAGIPPSIPMLLPADMMDMAAPRRAGEYLDSFVSESAGDASLERELAAAYDKVGDVQGLPSFANLGDTAGALRSHQRELALRQALLASRPNDVALQSDLSATHTHLGAIFEVMKDVPGAPQHARTGLALRETLAARNPGGVIERTNLAASYHQIGNLMTAIGDWQGALEHIQRETREFESLLAQDPSSGRAQRVVARGEGVGPEERTNLGGTACEGPLVGRRHERSRPASSSHRAV